MRLHMRIHSGERPCVCNFLGCTASFAQRNALVVHRRSYTNEKPYPCCVDGCAMAFATSYGMRRHHRRIHTERGIQRQKKREEQVAIFLQDSGILFDREVTVQFCGEATKTLARVDFVIYREFGTVIVEVDEFQHSHYPIPCESARMIDIFAEQRKQGKPGKVHIIRFNPDAYTEGGNKAVTLLKHRLARLLRVIELAPSQQYSVTYLYYNKADSPIPDVGVDREYPSSLRELVNW